MSYLQVTVVQPSLRVPKQFNTHHGSVNIYNLHNALKPTIGSSKKCTELMKCNVMQRSRYQQCTPMSLFGGKGDSKNGNEASSPWKSIEKAMSSFKKGKSLEDVLRQQMEKKDHYDGGSGGGGDPPSGGGGGGGGGFGGTEDEGFAGILDDILQVTLAILALIVLYLYIIVGDQVRLFIKDTFEFVIGKRGPRLRTIMYECAQFYQKFRAKVPYDPYWLEKEIVTTPTWWDSPDKYRRMLNKSSTRAIRSSKRNIDSDNDSDNDNAYDDDDDDSDNGYSEDVDDGY